MMTLLLALTQFALANSITPTLYECRGLDDANLTVGYTTSSFVGTPTFQVRSQDYQVPSRGHGLHIETHKTALGTMVTGMTHRKHVMDAPSTAYSVLIPTIHLDKMMDTVTFETYLLVGHVGGFTRSDAPLERIRQGHRLECTAQYAVF